MTVSELAALVGGQLASEQDGSMRVSGAAALADALPGEVTFFTSPKFLAALRASSASVALVPLDFSESVPAICIRCEDPGKAFALFLSKIAPEPVVFAPGIHATAVIGEKVKLGQEVSIQPYAVIEDGAEIGDRTVIGAYGYVGHDVKIGADCRFSPRVTVGERCVVGNRVIMHSGVVLGADGFGFEFKNGRHEKIPQTGIVQVDDDVEIGANSCIDRARFGRTWIQAGTKIDNLVQIGHNVVFGKHGIICSLVGIAGSAKLGNHVTLAGQVGVNGHIEVGDQAIFGGKAGIHKSLPGNQIYGGNPAIPMREHRERVARINQLEKLWHRVAALEQILRENGKSLPPET